MAGPKYKITDEDNPSLPTHIGVSYSLVYDVYVRCNNKQKLMQKHVPALNELLGLFDADWQIENEESNPPNEYRLMLSVDLETQNKSEILFIATKQMTRLHRSFGQNIDGANNPMEPLHIEMWYEPAQPKHGFPSVFSAIIAVYAEDNDALNL